VLAGVGVEDVVWVQPAVWKASMGLAGGKKGKAGSIALAQRLMPGPDRTEHEDEAALIAWYQMQRLLRAARDKRDGLG
jgi:hypothetical protein